MNDIEIERAIVINLDHDTQRLSTSSGIFRKNQISRHAPESVPLSQSRRDGSFLPVVLTTG